MKIAIIGYGKMGHEIERYALGKGHHINCIINEDKDWKEQINTLQNSDVAIEFSTPQTVIENIYKLLNLNIPTIVGTTGWYEHLDEITAYCSEKKGKLIYASNFSIGVNLLFAVNHYLAHIMENYPEYNLKIEETHHTAKLDCPSGTAISLANDIIRNNSNYTQWNLTGSNISQDTIPITAHRIADTPGIHTIQYSSEADTLSLTHTAFNRKGFAQGAIWAAEHIQNTEGITLFSKLLNIL